MEAAGNNFGDNVIDMKRILAVDDNQDILDVLRYILEDSGYEVDTLLCKNVKQTAETHNIPVILVSASHNIADSMKQNGAPDDFIAKPFDMHVLLNSIERQLAAA
jgi:DNA-binding response OmpR family regulator